MSTADLHDLELVWPSLGPTDVIVTGTFDQWSSSIHLVKGDYGFSGTIKVPFGQKVAYKFIVDGHWRCREDRPQEDDGHGNINNVLETPAMPLSMARFPPTLFIPLGDAHNEGGYGDIENMVTAVEFLPPVESARGPLPLPMPQISVEGLGWTPSAGTQLDTAGATEGHISPTSETAAKPDGSLPINENDPVVDARGQVHESTHLTNGEPGPFPPVPEIAKEAPESAAPQQGTGDTPALPDHVVAPTSAPVALSESTTKSRQGDTAENVASTLASTSISQTSTPPLTPKKRRSLLARIKHMFHRDNKQGKKEKH